MRYNPPPNWPAAPDGWTPPPGWQPDPAWGPAPEGWKVWVEEEQVAPTATRNRRRWVWPAATAVAFFMGIGIGGSGDANTAATTSTSSSAPTVTVTAAGAAAPAPAAETITAPAETVTAPAQTVTVTAKPEGPSGSFAGDGTFLVGEEIKAGTYKSAGGDGCYWQRSKGLSGSFDDIIANDNPSGPAIVTIKKSDKAFTSNDCGEWKRIS